MKKTNQRKSLFVNPQLQRGFLIYTMFSSLAVGVIYFFSLRYFLSSFQARGAEIGLSDDHIFFRFLADQQSVLDTVFAVSTLLILAYLVVSGLVMSNRIAGPIFRLEQYLREVREGKNVAPLKYREKDYFSTLAEEVNQTFAGKSFVEKAK